MCRYILTILLFPVFLGRADASDDVDYASQIKPILSAKCYSCHGALKQQSGLRLETRDLMRRGGEGGEVIVPGNSKKSTLIQRITAGPDERMPPTEEGAQLSAIEIALIGRWIDQGAKAPHEPIPTGPEDHWAFRPLTHPDIPCVGDSTWTRNPIDHFIARQHQQFGLTPQGEAPKEILLRRLYLGLIGLPPPLQALEALERSSASDWYERLIDRLLTSPRYGERWGRHWLDVARYADSENDARNIEVRNAWSYTYRDWVIAALNEDLPYNRFVLYQLAGDRVEQVNPRHLAALGFLSLGRNFSRSYPQTVDDRIDAVTRGFLGLTVSCARCHDHKYDPIPTEDYYALYSILANLRQPKELPLLGTPVSASLKQARYQKRLAGIQQEEHDYRVRRHAERLAFFKTQTAEYLVAAQDAEGLSVAQVEELVRERQLNLHVLTRWLGYLEKSKAGDNPLFRPWHTAAAIADSEFAATWPSVRNSVQGNRLLDVEIAAKPVTSRRDLAAAYAAALNKHDRIEPFEEPATERLRAVSRGSESPLAVPLDEFKLICSEGDLNNLFNLGIRYRNMLTQAAHDGAEPRAMAVENVPDPVPSHVLIRGNPNNLGKLTPPHFLSCLGGSDTQPFQNGTGRLELANAIINPENPLTARVIVNRVWMHHFGFGLVRSPSDFGLRGEPPSHPELLDYLAGTFMQSGWSLKKLHRLILTSAVYRQSSADNETARNKDPENRLLWKMNRRRLEIESVRDSMLAAAGRLDLTTRGVPFSLTTQPSAPRRTVYGFIQRSRIPSMLSTFDFASPEQHTPSRFVTTVPQQALFFLNSPFVTEQGRHLAARPEVASASTPRARIQQLYRFVFGRAPSPREMDAGLRFVSQSEADALHVTPTGPWQYGTGEYRTDTATVESFRPFPVFDSDRWQGGAVLPAPGSGTATLSATGGVPGEQPDQTVIRRWVSPVNGTLEIDGTLRHRTQYGDGVIGRVVSSRRGELASWTVHRSKVETQLSGTTVTRGDAIDFIVEAGPDPDGDGFGWAPVIKSGTQTWDAKNDFAGPTPKPLTVWERYAQALLETNEFAFVD